MLTADRHKGPGPLLWLEMGGATVAYGGANARDKTRDMT